MAGAAEASTDTDTADESDAEESASLIRCDECYRQYRRDDIDVVWSCGWQRFICDDCHSHRGVDRAIDLMRGK